MPKLSFGSSSGGCDSSLSRRHVQLGSPLDTIRKATWWSAHKYCLRALWLVEQWWGPYALGRRTRGSGPVLATWCFGALGSYLVACCPVQQLGTRRPSVATPSSTMRAGSATTPPLTPLLHLPLRPYPLTVAFELAPSPSGTADTQSVARSPPAGYTGLLGSRAAARTATWSSSGLVGAGNMPVRVQDGAAPVLRPDRRGSLRQHPAWRSGDPKQPVRRPRAAFPTTLSSRSGDPEQLYHHSWPPQWFFANGSSWHRGPAAQPCACLAVTVNTEAVPVHAVLAS
ncbi:uncharacterized protein LOC144144108 [Haemaphysalis longicornis]